MASWGNFKQRWKMKSGRLISGARNTRRARDFMDNLEAIETIEALGLDEIVREDGEPKRKPTMNEIRALYGLGAINNNEYVHLRKENAEDAVR